MMSEFEKAFQEEETTKSPIARRFRGFLPVVVDVETGGFNAQTDALLEIAAVILDMDENGRLYSSETHACHVQPFPGANIDEASLAFTGIDPYHPLRVAMVEQDALGKVFTPIRRTIKDTGCTRAILVGHNPFFDLGFLKAAVERTGIKRNPFHAFSTFDTATLGGLAYGQTVLARAAQAAGMEWDNREAHSALYDAERTAELFCKIINQWDITFPAPSTES
jgi:ribonuclease T